MISTDISPVLPEIQTLFRRKILLSFAIPAIVLTYLVYIFFAFDLVGIGQRARLDNAHKLISDSYSYKTHVTRDNRTQAVTISVEGERKGTYPSGESPDWVTLASDKTVIDLGDGHIVTYDGPEIRYDIPEYGQIRAIPGRAGIDLEFPRGGAADQPDWINASKNRLAVTTAAGRLSVTRNRSEVYKYSYGWELFWFTLDSPFYGKSLGELGALTLSDQTLINGKSNLSAIFHDFWHNPVWRHNEVAGALFETLLMAFLGTFGAAIVALPVAFLAARNFTPFRSIRFAVRRVFDFLRGVDALIWTIVLARAFGPGPLTGALAILFTDTGSFGKMFSEALENVDSKQIEGVASTGAKPLQRYRFGVLPQITPVLASQILYYLESNTRSATIIGAITGGGIGLLLTQAMITQKDWEEVTYFIILIIGMVMIMDWISGLLRQRLIKGSK